MKKRILAAVLASASILGAVAGCSSNATSSAASDASSTTDSSKTEDSSKSDESKTEATELKDDGDKLTILAWESNSDIVNMVKLFCKETGKLKTRSRSASRVQTVKVDVTSTSST